MKRNSYGRPTPRERREVPSDATVTLFVLVMALVVILGVWWGISHTTPVTTQETTQSTPVITHDSLAPSYTYDGTIVRWYVFTDPDHNVEYLFNDLGGVTPRLNESGVPVGVVEYSYD